MSVPSKFDPNQLVVCLQIRGNLNVWKTKSRTMDERMNKERYYGKRKPFPWHSAVSYQTGLYAGVDVWVRVCGFDIYQAGSK